MTKYDRIYNQYEENRVGTYDELFERQKYTDAFFQKMREIIPDNAMRDAAVDAALDYAGGCFQEGFQIGCRELDRVNREAENEAIQDRQDDID